MLVAWEGSPGIKSSKGEGVEAWGAKGGRAERMKVT